jgi:hypothetical protein
MKMTDSTDLSEHERTWENLAVTYMTLQRARELELAKVGLTIPQDAYEALPTHESTTSHYFCAAHSHGGSRPRKDNQRPGQEELGQSLIDQERRGNIQASNG